MWARISNICLSCYLIQLFKTTCGIISSSHMRNYKWECFFFHLPFFFWMRPVGGSLCIFNPPKMTFWIPKKGILKRSCKEDLARFTFFLTCSNELGRCGRAILGHGPCTSPLILLHMRPTKWRPMPLLNIHQWLSIINCSLYELNKDSHSKINVLLMHRVKLRS